MFETIYIQIVGGNEFGVSPSDLGDISIAELDPGSTRALDIVINIKCPSGNRIELSNRYVAQVEQEIREIWFPP